MPPGGMMMPPNMMKFQNMGGAEDDENMSEEQKEQMKMFNTMFAGTDFDKKLDAFIDKQLESGMDMETIMANAMKGMPG